MRTIVSLLVFAHTAVYCGALDLETAQYTAQNKRPLLKSYEQSIQSRKVTERQALAPLLPQLSASHTSTAETLQRVDTAGHTVTLSGSQLLFDAAGPLAQRTIAAHDTARARYAYYAASQANQEEVTHAFLDAWLMQEKKHLIAALDIVAQEEMQSAQTAYRLEKINVRSYKQACSLYESRQSIIHTYAHEEAKTRTILNNLVNHPVELHHLAFTPLPAKPLQPETHYQELAQQNRPELKEKKEEIQQHAFQAGVHRSGYLPSVSISGSLSKTYGGTAALRGTDALISVRASWAFFDGLSHHYKAQGAEAERLRSEFALAEQRNHINTQVNTAYHTLQANIQALLAAQTKHDEMTTSWRQTEDEWRLGVINQLEYATEKYLYEEAAHAVRTAQVTVRKNEETLAYRCGYPADWAAIATPTTQLTCA